MKISPRKYAQALAQTLETAEDSVAIISNFLHILRRRKQFRMLPKILKAFEDEWAARRGVVKMTVSFPPRFKDSLNELTENLSAKLNRKIDVKFVPVESLIGGFRVQTGDTLIDGSIEGMLKILKSHL